MPENAPVNLLRIKDIRLGCRAEVHFIGRLGHACAHDGNEFSLARCGEIPGQAWNDFSFQFDTLLELTYTSSFRETELSAANSSSGEPVAGIELASEFERDLASLLRAENRDPFRFLGPHIVDEGGSKRLVVRGFFRGRPEPPWCSMETPT